MYDIQEHLANLTRHINLVQEACMILGKRMIEAGRHEFGRILIARGFVHDSSKFYGIEWDYMHVGPDVDQEKLDQAIKQHVTTNDHHPEFWGGIAYMPSHARAEMVCDWYARSQEFGTNLREWIAEVAVPRFGITTEDLKEIMGYVDILLPNHFKPAEETPVPAEPPKRKRGRPKKITTTAP